MNETAQATLTAGGWGTLAILGTVLVLLVTNKIRIDIIGIFILLALGLSSLVEEKELFAGFSSEAVIVIAAMLAIGEALVLSGVTDAMSAWITRVGGNTERRLVFSLMLVAGLATSFISDLAVVSILLPVVLGFEQRLGIPASKLLIPLAVASMLGIFSMVGSSSFIVANQVLAESGQEPLALFAIAPIGAFLLTAGILFFWLFGRFLLPEHGGRRLGPSRSVGAQDYMTELQVTKSSAWLEQKLRDITFFKENGIHVVRILRNGDRIEFPRARTQLRAGDVLLVQARREDLLKLRSNTDFYVQEHVHKSLQESKVGAAGEAIVRQGSIFVGRTLQQLGFRERYDVAVLAIWRDGKTIRQRLATIPLRTGDMLLLQGPRDKMNDLAEEEGLMMVSQTSHHPKTRRKALTAVLILLLALLSASLNLMPMSVAGMLAVGSMVVFRVMSMNRVYGAIDWQILVFVAAMIPLGTAMKETGIIDVVAHQIVGIFGQWGPYAVLAACFWLAALTTQVLSNTATALLLTPVVIGAATSLGVNPIPFVVMVMSAVSASPITYVSHKAFLVIMAPGGYKYSDYVKIGVPITVMCFVILMLIVPWLWPLQ